MYVRFMRRQDVPQVSAIDHEAFPADWPPNNFNRELENLLAYYLVVSEKPPAPVTRAPAPPKGWLARLRAWLRRRQAQVSVPEDRLLGYAGMWVMADEAHVMSIASRQENRRQGIGEGLLIGLIELAQKHLANVVTLEVRLSNKGAQNLYAKYGFKEKGIRKGYYLDNREDAIIMTTDYIRSPEFRDRLRRLKETHARQWGGTQFDLERRADKAVQP